MRIASRNSLFQANKNYFNVGNKEPIFISSTFNMEIYMTTLSILKETLKSSELTLSVEGMFSNKRVTLSANNNMTFKWLGSGTNKNVFRIVGEPWVLAIAGMSKTAEGDILDEVKTLRRIAKCGIKVPKPFQGNISATDKDFTFSLDGLWDDQAGSRMAFIQEYLPYIEMKKANNPENFVKLNIIGRTRTNIIAAALRDLSKIQRAYKFTPWGDFQVMYNRSTGNFYVFDPMPTPNPGQFGLKTPDVLLKTWIKQLEDDLFASAQRQRVSKSILERYIKESTLV